MCTMRDIDENYAYNLGQEISWRCFMQLCVVGRVLYRRFHCSSKQYRLSILLVCTILYTMVCCELEPVQLSVHRKSYKMKLGLTILV